MYFSTNNTLPLNDYGSIDSLDSETRKNKSEQIMVNLLEWIGYMFLLTANLIFTVRNINNVKLVFILNLIGSGTLIPIGFYKKNLVLVFSMIIWMIYSIFILVTIFGK